MASAGTILLPAHSSGLHYKFYIAAYTAALGIKADPGTIVYGAAANGASVAAASGADWFGGTMLEFLSDGTNWYMSYSAPGAEADELIAVSGS
jgi:hypothetical protein